MTQELTLLDAIYTTRAIRKFSAERVPLDLVAKVLEAATQAPSGVNSQPWRFLVVDEPEKQEQLAEMYRTSYFGRRAGWDLDEKTSSSVFLANRFGEAPLHILVCGPDSRNHTGPDALTMSVPAAVYPATQNLLLAARAYGLGGVLTINHEPFNPALRNLFAIPDRFYIYAVVPMGFAAERHGRKTRKAVSDVTFYNNWGEPFGEA